MLILGKIIKILGWIILFIAAGILLIENIFTLTDQGFNALAERLSPFNIGNLFMYAIFLGPGLLIMWLGKKIENRYKLEEESD